MNGRSTNQVWLDLARDRRTEARVLELRAQGLTQAVIGARLGLHPSRIGQILRRVKREQARV